MRKILKNADNKTNKKEKNPYMKVTFEKTNLESVVNDSLCAVSDKNTIPVVEGIRFRTENNGTCSLTTYDLEKGFQSEVPCDVFSGGNYVINAQKLSRIIKSMSDRFITIEVDENCLVSITGGRSKFELHALEGKNFPSLPELKGERGFTINAGTLKKIIAQTAFSIAVTDQRPMFCGAYFEITNNKLKVVTCDGNRLAIREKECDITNKNEDGSELELKFIVPGKTIAQLTRLMADDEDVCIYLGRKHVIFQMENKTFFSRLIDGDYIDYNKVIPAFHSISVKADRMAIISSLERALLVTEDKGLGQTKSPVRCAFEGDVLKISSRSVTGSVYDEINIDKVGADLVIGFNCRYLLETLKACEEETVEILMSSPLLSILVRSGEGDNAERVESEEGFCTKITKSHTKQDDEKESEKYLYMVCPVKMND